MPSWGFRQMPALLSFPVTGYCGRVLECLSVHSFPLVAQFPIIIFTTLCVNCRKSFLACLSALSTSPCAPPLSWYSQDTPFTVSLPAGTYSLNSSASCLCLSFEVVYIWSLFKSAWLPQQNTTASESRHWFLMVLEAGQSEINVLTKWRLSWGLFSRCLDGASSPSAHVTSLCAGGES